MWTEEELREGIWRFMHTTIGLNQDMEEMHHVWTEEELMEEDAGERFNLS